MITKQILQSLARKVSTHLRAFKSILDDLKFIFSRPVVQKCTLPLKVQELLGNVIDIPNSELKMSQERQIEILQELNAMSLVKVTTRKKLLSLIGKLSFIIKVVRSGCTFLRCLVNIAKSVKYLHFKVKMNERARRDIA